jgi:predicted N-acetyltransferase YhbS
MEISIRQAALEDAAKVSAILQEAARWLEDRGAPLWQLDELSATSITSDLAGGLFFIAEDNGEPAGTIRFQLEDPQFWPDIPPGMSAFVHRLAVRRRHAGGIVASELLKWAAARTRMLGRQFLRLDCDAARPWLRAVYERFGFRHHSDRQVGPYYVSRYEYAVFPELPSSFGSTVQPQVPRKDRGKT